MAGVFSTLQYEKMVRLIAIGIPSKINQPYD